MARINIKSIFVKQQPVGIEAVEDPYPSISATVKELLSSAQQHLPSELTNSVSELYSKTCVQLKNLTQDKSNGELLFMGTILAAVLLVVLILPAYEAFCAGREKSETVSTQSKPIASSKSKPIPSSNCSATESLETIEESEEEDMVRPVEVVETLKFVDDGEDQVQVYDADDQPSNIVANEEEVFDADDKQLDSTPATAGKQSEAPAASPHSAPEENVVDAGDKQPVAIPVTVDDKCESPTDLNSKDECETPTPSSPGNIRPTLTRDYVSVPNISSAPPTRSNLAKMANRLSFKRKGSDASVTSMSSKSNRKRFSLKKSQRAV